MVKLTEWDDQFAAARLVERLEEAGIEAQVQLSRSFLVEATSTVLIVNDADLPRAREGMAGFEQELRISTLDEASRGGVCKGCGYSLKGLTGEGRCPECGHAYRGAGPSTVCLSCGADVPANFEVCWSCGKPPGSCPECNVPLPEPRPGRCPSCGIAIQARARDSDVNESDDAMDQPEARKPWWKFW